MAKPVRTSEENRIKAIEYAEQHGIQKYRVYDNKLIFDKIPESSDQKYIIQCTISLGSMMEVNKKVWGKKVTSC